jgi:hypothetical protein
MTINELFPTTYEQFKQLSIDLAMKINGDTTKYNCNSNKLASFISQVLPGKPDNSFNVNTLKAMCVTPESKVVHIPLTTDKIKDGSTYYSIANEHNTTVLWREERNGQVYLSCGNEAEGDGEDEDYQFESLPSELAIAYNPHAEAKPVNVPQSDVACVILKAAIGDVSLYLSEYRDAVIKEIRKGKFDLYNNLNEKNGDISDFFNEFNHIDTENENILIPAYLASNERRNDLDMAFDSFADEQDVNSGLVFSLRRAVGYAYREFIKDTLKEFLDQLQSHFNDDALFFDEVSDEKLYLWVTTSLATWSNEGSTIPFDSAKVSI